MQAESILPVALQDMLDAEVTVPLQSPPGPQPWPEAAAWQPPPSSFRADLHRTWTAVIRSPGLLAVSLALSVVPAALRFTSKNHPQPAWAVLVYLPVLLFVIGFGGTQRFWLVRVWGGSRVSSAQVWSLTWRYFGRYFRLGLMVTWPFVMVLIIAAVVSNGWVTVLAIGVGSLLLDVLLTFVVPELAFVSDSASDAWRGGRQLLRATWPNSRWYALTPGLSVLAVANSIGRLHVNPWENAVAAGVAAFLALLMKGTILAYYLRLRPRAPEGRY